MKLSGRDFDGQDGERCRRTTGTEAQGPRRTRGNQAEHGSAQALPLYRSVAKYWVASLIGLIYVNRRLWGPLIAAVAGDSRR